MRIFLPYVSVVFLLPTLPAQMDPFQWLTVRGQLLLKREIVPAGLQVELRSLDRQQPNDQAQVMDDGSFEFRRLLAGHYEAKVINVRGEVIQQDFISIQANGEPLNLRARWQEPAPPPSGTVSWRRLLRPVPPKAAKEFRRAQDASERGDEAKSVRHLHRAIEIFPDYLEAHNNLGVRYMAAHQYDAAVAEFQTAVELDPDSGKGQLNLSLAWMALHRYSEAEAAARRAVRLEPHSTPARFTLGQSLVYQDKRLPEALEHLRHAIVDYPDARLLVARLLLLQGAIPEATTELRAYLPFAQPQKRQFVESWLHRLTPRAP